MLVELLDELDRSDYSQSLLRALPRELEAREAWFEIYAAGYCTASNIELRTGGIGAALRILDRAERYAGSQHLGHLRQLLLWQRVDLLVRAGEPERARQLLHSSGDLGSDSGRRAAWRETALRALSKAALLLAEGCAEEALATLRPQREEARRLGHRRSLIRYALLESLALSALGAQDEAQAALLTALEAARSSGFLRALLDAPEGLDELLQRALADCTDSRQRRFLGELLARRGAKGSGPATSSALSAREAEILGQVALGRSNKEAARALSISENTVRFHLKNVYLKLRVNRRAEAVAQALAQGLLRLPASQSVPPAADSAHCRVRVKAEEAGPD